MGLSPGTEPSELQRQYRALIKAHPPDVDPQRFEQIRDAYARVTDPHAQAWERILGPRPLDPLELESALRTKRRRASEKAWLAALKELRRR